MIGVFKPCDYETLPHCMPANSSISGLKALQKFLERGETSQGFNQSSKNNPGAENPTSKQDKHNWTRSAFTSLDSE